MKPLLGSACDLTSVIKSDFVMYLIAILFYANELSLKLLINSYFNLVYGTVCDVNRENLTYSINKCLRGLLSAIVN